MQGKQIQQQQLFHYFDIESLIPKSHLLRQINQHVDLTFVRELTKPYYCSNNGRPSIDPELFFRMILIGYLYNVKSDRQLCEQIQYNLAYRWFCRLGLEDHVPDHSSLTRIRDRLGLDVFHKFFIKIVEQCKEYGLATGEHVMTDGTLFQANASLDSLTLKNNENQDSENLKTIKRGIQAPPRRKLSNQTHISKTDPDATLAFKNGTPRTLKYKAHMTIDADSRVILDAKITTGATHESQVYLNQLQSIESNLDIKIVEATADRAYGSGHIIQSLIDNKVKTNIPLFSGRSGSSMANNLDGFIYNKEDNLYHCPAGKMLYPYPSIQNDVMMYRSQITDCTPCQLKKYCKAKPKTSINKRYITRNVHQDLFSSVKISMQEDYFQAKLIERMWKMEGVISEAKNLHGLSRARYRGLNKTQIQAYMAASAMNMKRLIGLFIALYLLAHFTEIFLDQNIKIKWC